MTVSTAAREQRATPQARLVCALLLFPASLCGYRLSAQMRNPRPPASAQQQAAAQSMQQRSSAAASASAASLQHPQTPEALAPRAPVARTSTLPADQPPRAARVSWDSRGLEINASNSSLAQILHRVAGDTGARLEGPIPDQRIFGRYGPGPGCDVLSKLLDGSGYNVLMVGSRDTDMPLEIILSVRSPAGPATAANTQHHSPSEDDAENIPEPQPQREFSFEPPHPRPAPNPFANGKSTGDPVQFMQQILQRQQKIDQQAQEKEKNPQQ